MSAPTSHDPKFVNTKDGVCWEQRAVTVDGRGLYAVEGSCKCPPFKMATLAELAEHGIVGSADVLPVPVGSQPLADDDRAMAPWGRDEDGRPFLGPCAHWTDVPELVDQELARIRGRVDRAQSGHWYVASDTEAWRPAGTVRTNVDGYQRTVGRVTNMGSADLDLVLHAHDDLSWCLEMVAKFRARVTELELERHSTNEALSDAAVALRAGRAVEDPCHPCGCPKRFDRHADGCPTLPVGRATAGRKDDVTPQVKKLRSLLAGQRAGLEDPHDSPLYHPYTTPHDLGLPGAGGR